MEEMKMVAATMKNVRVSGPYELYFGRPGSGPTQPTLNKASRHNIINSIYFTVGRNSNTGGICLDV